MIEVGRWHRVITPARAWENIPIEWSPGLLGQFVLSWFWIVLLAGAMLFVKFAETNNYAGFIKQLPRAVPLLLLTGPGALRWVDAGKKALLTDCWWLMAAANTVFALCFPMVGTIAVKAQVAPSAEKSKSSTTKTTNSDQANSETAAGKGDPFLRALKRLGINTLTVEALPVADRPALRELTIEYIGKVDLGKFGVFKMFGFGELRPGSQFNNNSFTYFPWRKLPLGFTSEQGWNGKRGFGDAGIKWNIGDTPHLKEPLGKFFDFATLSYTRRFAGAAPKEQYIFVWDTKTWFAWKDKLGLSSEGFIRIRPGGTINYGQPQVLVQFGHCTWALGLVQFDTLGHKVGVSAGAKFYFSLR